MQDRKDYFKNYPKVDTFHFTSDGTAFFDKHEAMGHAKGLDDQTVDTVHRKDLKKQKESETKKTKTKESEVEGTETKESEIKESEAEETETKQETTK